MTTQTEARPLFAATLTPHRSLTRHGLRWVLALVVIAASVPTVIFFALGAWPVVGFLGLDILAVWWALSASLSDGRRMEVVTLWADQLELKCVGADGRQQLRRFDPFVVKLVIDRDFHERTTALHLRTREDDIVIGAFLNAEEKSSFARAFGTALKRARQGR